MYGTTGTRVPPVAVRRSAARGPQAVLTTTGTRSSRSICSAYGCISIAYSTHGWKVVVVLTDILVYYSKWKVGSSTCKLL